jgi:nitrile hydratase
MGKIMAKAWSDPGFKKRLQSDPATVLMELRFSLPADMEIVVLENTPEMTYLVLGAPRRVEPLSAIYDIKRFGDTYRDPRLHPFNWVSHDPVHTARIKTDPVAALAEMGIEVAESMTVKVLENSWTRTHLVLPPQPAPGELDDDTLRRVSEGWLGPTVCHAALYGLLDYRMFANAT